MEWRGQPKFTIGHSSEDKELLQLRSEQMYLTIPEYVFLPVGLDLN